MGNDDWWMAGPEPARYNIQNQLIVSPAILALLFLAEFYNGNTWSVWKFLFDNKIYLEEF